MGRYGHTMFGEYVHLSYQNYLKWGLARGTNKSAPPTTVQDSLQRLYGEEKKRVIQKLKSQMQNYNLNRLSDQISAVSGSEGRSVQSQDATSAIRQAVTHHMQQFVANLEVSDINWETFTLKPSAIKKVRAKVSPQLLDEYFDNLQKAEAARLGIPESKIKRIKVLASSTLRNTSLGASGNSYVQPWLTQIANLNGILTLLKTDASNKDLVSYKKLEETLKQVQVAVQNAAATGKKLVNTDSLNIGNVFTKDTGSFKQGDVIPLYYELRLVSQAILKTVSLKIIHGELMEAVVAASSDAIQGQIQTAENGILTNVIGSLKGSNIISKSKFNKSLNQNEIFKGSKFQDRGGNDLIAWTTSNTPKGKVDVILQSNASTFLGASVKNYRFGTGTQNMHDMGLVSGSNIIYLMQDRVYFVNHYLNQTTNRTDTHGTGDVPTAATIIMANQQMKKMLLLQALVGGGKRTDITSGKAASVFVVNDQSKKHGVKVVAMNQVYEKFVQDMGTISITLDDNQTWLNNKANNGASARITTLLAAIRAKKITVTVPRTVVSRAINSI